MSSFTIRGNLVDVDEQKIYQAELKVENERIASIEPADQLHYILPRFIDAHIHIESSSLVPSQLARLAVVHGTIATVSNPSGNCQCMRNRRC